MKAPTNWPRGASMMLFLIAIAAGAWVAVNGPFFALPSFTAFLMAAARVLGPVLVGTGFEPTHSAPELPSPGQLGNEGSPSSDG